jgi:hypothetical protein
MYLTKTPIAAQSASFVLSAFPRPLLYKADDIFPFRHSDKQHPVEENCIANCKLKANRFRVSVSHRFAPSPSVRRNLASLDLGF